MGEVEVSPQWLGTARGIAGYNEMMMSADFYSLFNDYEYIIICHVDAWVFRDELDDWCRRGYDHVAAPWPTRKRYTRFPLKQYLWLKLRLKPAHKILHCQMFGRIGNGGFSLRRVSVFRDACLKYADEIARFKTSFGPSFHKSSGCPPCPKPSSFRSTSSPVSATSRTAGSCPWPATASTNPCGQTSGGSFCPR